jgi:hypothetical protein
LYSLFKLTFPLPYCEFSTNQLKWRNILFFDWVMEDVE